LQWRFNPRTSLGDCLILAGRVQRGIGRGACASCETNQNIAAILGEEFTWMTGLAEFAALQESQFAVML